jgi:TolB protein
MYFVFKRIRLYLLLLVATLPLLLIGLHTSRSQDWFSIGINLGAPKIKMAVSDFPPGSVDQNLVKLTQEFNQVLWYDLEQSGIFDLVSKSYYPVTPPREPQEVDFKAWSSAPASAQMLAFGKTEVINSSLVITGRLFDLGSPANPSVIAKRYVATLNEIATCAKLRTGLPTRFFRPLGAESRAFISAKLHL